MARDLALCGKPLWKKYGCEKARTPEGPNPEFHLDHPLRRTHDVRSLTLET
jgi:hypothetical protein